MSFGEWLRERRTELRISGAELEKLSGVSRQYISNLERGLLSEKNQLPIQPSLDVVIKLAKALRANPDEARLAAGYAPQNVDPDGLYAGLDQLSPERQAIAKKQIKAIIDSLAEKEHDTNYIG